MSLDTILHRDPIADRGISVVLVVRDAAGSLTPLVDRVAETLDRKSRGYEIIVVNDGSRDDTAQVAEKLVRANRRVRVVSHESAEGYGASMHAGFRLAKYPLVLQLSGIDQYDPAEIDGLLGVIDQVDIACGYRPPSGSWSYWWYRLVIRIIFAVRIRDVDCEFRLYRRSALRRIPIQSMGRFANAEILAKATFMGMLIGEVPVTSRQVEGVEPAGGSVWRDAVQVFRRPRFCASNATIEKTDSAVGVV